MHYTHKNLHVKSQLSYWTLLTSSSGFAVILYIITSSAGESPHREAILAVLIPITVLFLVYQTRHHFRIKRALKVRSNQFSDISLRNKWQYQPSETKVPEAFASATFPKVNWIDKKFANHITAPDWSYVDVLYERKHRSGTTMITLFYSVMVRETGMSLPHMLFDSRRARSYQYLLRFSSGQKHKINPAFDSMFATYAVKNSSKDVRKFVSPGLQEILLLFTDYDVELAGDRIFLYGPLLDAETQLSDMEQKLKFLHAYLRADTSLVKSTKAPKLITAKLQGSHFIAWGTAAIFGVYITLLIVKFTS